MCTRCNEINAEKSAKRRDGRPTPIPTLAPPQPAEDDEEEEDKEEAKEEGEDEEGDKEEAEVDDVAMARVIEVTPRHMGICKST